MPGRRNISAVASVFYAMGCLLLLILLVIVFGAGSVIAVGLSVGLVLTLLVAGLIGWAADLVVPGGALPGGWIGAVLTGVIGGFVGAWLFAVLGIHDPGFTLFGVDLVPAFVGAVVVAFAAQLLTSRRPVV
jgi:uncharacterized membrane protein YeaQ/YmgE (transglycosylase-associated protein family)